jgi:hypothetical protein
MGAQPIGSHNTFSLTVGPIDEMHFCWLLGSPQNLCRLFRCTRFSSKCIWAGPSGSHPIFSHRSEFLLTIWVLNGHSTDWQPQYIFADRSGPTN